MMASLTQRGQACAPQCWLLGRTQQPRGARGTGEAAPHALLVLLTQEWGAAVTQRGAAFTKFSTARSVSTLEGCAEPSQWAA